jgi:hypothetical protein
MAIMSFDPRAFGMADGEMSFNEYLKKLTDGTKKFNGPVRTYLNFIINYLNTGGKLAPKDKALLVNLFKSPEVIDAKRKIQKDFGETLGPLGLVKLQLFGKSSNISSVKIRYPSKQNEGLYDYEISLNNGTKWFKISAKVKGGKSNTVKPKDIINAFDGKQVPKNLQLAYNFVEKIQSLSTATGSQAALKLLENAKIVPKRNVTSKVEAETIFETITKQKDNAFAKQMNELFWKAIEYNQLHFVKFGLSREGIPLYDRVSDELDVHFEDGKVIKVKNPDDQSPFVYFRGKGREAGEKRSEKPGFQT